MNPTSSQLRQMRRDNLSYPSTLRPIDPAIWPHDGEMRIAVFRSRTFLVQVFEQNGMIRLSANRTEWDERQKRWREDITWDDLQRLKGEAGYADHVAVETFPPDNLVVNVANMRHLWIFPIGELPAFVWKNGA